MSRINLLRVQLTMQYCQSARASRTDVPDSLLIVVVPQVETAKIIMYSPIPKPHLQQSEGSDDVPAYVYSWSCADSEVM